ncbi:HSF-type DNA-binding-domain-containing protein [Radiomyces spectabilis]|uniref:HSF-type DNA-binding-domain-containing protein n=1 Tax=Radiomyces spectabilis TaxID=64574 RepID=UPI00221FEA1F|nr:HSF-type DNA-binding-domain-containing protein [Radiomyces spectabilis]KAI8384758.1 HSF-type DNA-binding-domain-containing protein [Radiomyces spectabilis]
MVQAHENELPSSTSSTKNNMTGNDTQNKPTKKIPNRAGASNTTAIPEFIQKLFRMLEDDSLKNTFSWNESGNSFIVKDTNDFSKTVLPKHFKHCNFASFVRQLNKYDFHKVRNNESNPKVYGDQRWEFVHPKFQRDHKHLLEQIRRKTPGKPKREDSADIDLPLPTAENGHFGDPSSSTGSSTSSYPSSASLEELLQLAKNLQTQVDQLQKARAYLEAKICHMERTDQLILNELSQYQKNIAVKDDILRAFLEKFISTEKDTTTTPMCNMNATDTNGLMISVDDSRNQAQEIVKSYTEMSRQHTQTLEKLTNELRTPSMTAATGLVSSTIPRISSSSTSSSLSPPIIPITSHTVSFSDPEAGAAAAAAASMNAGSLVGSPMRTADGRSFVTLGRLSAKPSAGENTNTLEITAPSLIPSAFKQHVPSAPRDKPIQPGWTVPPRVLLVDDDSVYRELSGKLLNMIGCNIDLAKDGLEAVRKMGLEKYDLILMDIVMPNLDGVSATRNIRQYDAYTPIISMTSNFTDNDIIEYVGSGMTDILPKPFSKSTLYNILEKYCAHLKAIQQVQGIDQTVIQRGLKSLGLLQGMPSSTQSDGPSASSSSSSSSSTPFSTASPVPSSIPISTGAHSYMQPPPGYDAYALPNSSCWTASQGHVMTKVSPSMANEDTKMNWATSQELSYNENEDTQRKRQKLNDGIE